MYDQAPYDREEMLRSRVERAIAKLRETKDPDFRVLARQELNDSLHAFGVFLFSEPC